MSIRPLLVALLLSTSTAVAAQDAPGDPFAHGHRPEPTPTTEPVAATQEALAAASADFAACAFETSLPADVLGPSILRVVVSPRGRAVATFGVAPPGAPRGLLSCLARIARRAVTRVHPRFDAERTFELRPFEALPSMSDAPPPARGTLDEASLAALTTVLGRTADEDARLDRLTGHLSGGIALPLASAVRILATFRTRSVPAAMALCRATTGDDVAGSLARRLPARQRGWFLVASAGRCGVVVSAPDPALPAGAQCATDGDCAPACRHPPDCCGGQCGCSEAAPVAEAARMALACEARTEPRRCPAVACAYERYTPACVEGRCVALSARDVMPGIRPHRLPHPPAE